MPIVDTRIGHTGDSIAADLCIIGSGPAGLTLARALADTRLRVLVVESGGLEPDPQTQALNQIEQVGQPWRGGFMTRLRLVGGTSNLWPGRCMRLGPLDLGPRDWLGLPGWPIGTEMLDRYYPAAARILRLPPLPRAADGSDLCRPSNAEARLLTDSALVGDTALWARAPLRFGKAHPDLLRHSPRLTLLTQLTAVDIRLNVEANQVVAIRAATAAGRTFELKASRFVLACGGLENARLLLASNSQCTAGVGNAEDQVGRCFMDHPRAVLGRLDLAPGVDLGRLLGLPLAAGRLKTGLALAPERQRAAELVNCLLELEPVYTPMSGRVYGSAQEVVRWMLRRRYGHQTGEPVSWAEATRYIYQLSLREIIPHRIYHLLHRIKRKASRQLMAVIHCEQPPAAHNRVRLGQTHDHLGMPRLVLDWRVGAAETRAAEHLLQAVNEACGRHGLGALAPDYQAGRFEDASHHMGTTRMSDAPRQGVVNADCRVHGIANLYVAGSSVFPTGGYANPTLTIVALALRLAEHLRNTESY